MKRLIILLLLLPSLTFAQGGMGPGPGCKSYSAGGGGATCTTEVTGDKDTTAPDGAYGIGQATRYKIAGNWTTSEAYCLCKITIQLKKTGTPNGTVSIKVYDNSTDKPGNLLGTATQTYTKDSTTTSYADYTVTFASCINLANATIYWVSAETDTLNDASNYFNLGYKEGGGKTNRMSGYIAAWASISTSARVYTVPYK